MNENIENWEHSPFEELFSNAVFFFQKDFEKNEDENLYSRQVIVNSVFALEASANCCINMLDISKVYIKIPFKNKDSVKKLGCKWDPEKKSWYYLSNIDKNKVSEIMKLT